MFISENVIVFQRKWRQSIQFIPVFWCNEISLLMKFLATYNVLNHHTGPCDRLNSLENETNKKFCDCMSTTTRQKIQRKIMLGISKMNFKREILGKIVEIFAHLEIIQWVSMQRERVKNTPLYRVRLYCCCRCFDYHNQPRFDDQVSGALSVSVQYI